MSTLLVKRLFGKLKWVDRPGWLNITNIKNLIINHRYLDDRPRLNIYIMYLPIYSGLSEVIIYYQEQGVDIRLTIEVTDKQLVEIGLWGIKKPPERLLIDTNTIHVKDVYYEIPSS